MRDLPIQHYEPRSTQHNLSEVPRVLLVGGDEGWKKEGRVRSLLVIVASGTPDSTSVPIHGLTLCWREISVDWGKVRLVVHGGWKWHVVEEKKEDDHCNARAGQATVFTKAHSSILLFFFKEIAGGFAWDLSNIGEILRPWAPARTEVNLHFPSLVPLTGAYHTRLHASTLSSKLKRVV